MASKQSQAVTDMYRMWRDKLLHPDSANPLGHIEHWGDLTSEPRGVDYLEVDAGGVPAMWVMPKGCAQDRVLLCLHGGGFISGSIYTHRKLFAHLAKAIGARALISEYRLAPAHVHPAPVDDTTRAYQWLLAQGIRASRVAFTGDSAGGGLCLTTVLRARERGLPPPAALMLMSPWVDMELKGGSYESNRERDAFFHREVVQGLVDTFLGKTGDPKDPLANPLYADLTGFPPIYIHAGGDETLLDESAMLEALARKAGVDVRRDVFLEQQHTFQMAAGWAPEADDAIRRFAVWVAPKLGLAVEERAAVGSI